MRGGALTEKKMNGGVLNYDKKTRIKMMFSKACEYAIKAVIYIAMESRSNNRVSLKGISESIDSPEAFTAKILQRLARHEIIKSVKGPAGGFEMDEQKRKAVTLGKIVFAIDGDSIYMGCGLGLPECSDTNPCPVHHRFKSVRDGLRNMLENTNIEDLTPDLINGLVFLKRSPEVEEKGS